jgi:hypothetical protein
MLQQVIGSVQLDLLRALDGLTGSGLLISIRTIGNGQRCGRGDAHRTRFGLKYLRVRNFTVRTHRTCGLGYLGRPISRVTVEYVGDVPAETVVDFITYIMRRWRPKGARFV